MNLYVLIWIDIYKANSNTRLQLIEQRLNLVLLACENYKLATTLQQITWPMEGCHLPGPPAE